MTEPLEPVGNLDDRHHLSLKVRDEKTLYARYIHALIRHIIQLEKLMGERFEKTEGAKHPGYEARVSRQPELQSFEVLLDHWPEDYIETRTHPNVYNDETRRHEPQPDDNFVIHGHTYLIGRSLSDVSVALSEELSEAHSRIDSLKWKLNTLEHTQSQHDKVLEIKKAEMEETKRDLTRAEESKGKLHDEVLYLKDEKHRLKKEIKLVKEDIGTSRYDSILNPEELPASTPSDRAIRVE